MAPNGKAIAVWLEERTLSTNSTRTGIYVRAYTPDSGWGNTVAFATSGDVNAYKPKPAINSNGDAIVLWTQTDTQGGPEYINAVRYTAATSAWDSAPTQVLSDAEVNRFQSHGLDISGQATLDDNGNAFYAFSAAVFLSSESGAWVKEYRSGTWSPATRFLASATSYAKDLHIATSPDGKAATAVWKQLNTSSNKYRVLASEYRQGSGWAVGHEIDGNLAESYGPAKIAIAANGDTTAVWEASTSGGSRTDIYAARLSNGAWNTPTIVTGDPIGRDGYLAGLCSDAAGNAVMVTLPSFSLGQVAASRFTVDQGWQAPVQIPPDGQNFIVPQASVACNTKGDAMVSYRAALGANNSYDLWARPFTASGGWGTAAQIVSLGAPGSLTLSTPVVGLDDSFRALTLWRQDQQPGGGLNKPRDLWSATYK